MYALRILPRERGNVGDGARRHAYTHIMSSAALYRVGPTRYPIATTSDRSLNVSGTGPLAMIGLCFSIRTAALDGLRDALRTEIP